MTTTDYDVIVIGAGPGGYVAADRAALRGRRVLLIERGQLGGVCLNAGCIPTKTLLHSAKLYAQVLAGAKYGVEAEAPRFSLATAQARKGRVVAGLRDGIDYQMNRRGVTVVSGSARLLDRQTVEVDGSRYRGGDLIIATGASPVIPAIPGSDLPHVLTTTQLLERETLPQTLVILGGGALALGLATIFALVGVPVTLIEPGAQLLPALDSEIVNLLSQELTAQNITLHLDCHATAITEQGVTCRKAGEALSIPAETVLICGDRQPNVTGLGLEALDLDYDSSGIRVNDQMQTNLPRLYATGDVTGLSMWAHSASRMAEVAVNTIIGTPDRFRLSAVPVAVYTYPEVASVGLTEQAAKAQGIDVLTARLPLSANGRFMTENDGRRGLCKVVVSARTHALLGVHMIGGACSEQIFGAAALLEDEFRVQDVQQVVFAHPTVAEIIRDTLYEIPL